MFQKDPEGPKDPVRLSKLRQTSQAAFAASSFSRWFKFLPYFHDEGARMHIVARASNVDICLNSDKSRLRGYKIHNVAQAAEHRVVHI